MSQHSNVNNEWIDWIAWDFIEYGGASSNAAAQESGGQAQAARIDLNYPPSLPPSNIILDGSFLSLSTNPEPVAVPIQLQGCSRRREVENDINDIEVIDDELAIISPSSFAQARGDRGTAVSTTSPAKHKRLSDGSDREGEGPSNKKAKGVSKPEEETQGAPEHEEPIFTCPICLGDLVEPTSTKCGHIFCKECIHKSLKSTLNKNRCPHCRQKVGKRSIFRVYLPATKPK